MVRGVRTGQGVRAVTATIYKKGDRVKFIGHTEKCPETHPPEKPKEEWTPLDHYCGSPIYPWNVRVGKLAVVAETQDDPEQSVHIEFDDGDSCFATPTHVEAA